MTQDGPDSPAFLQRCSYWRTALDPAHLLASQAEIKRRVLEVEGGKVNTEDGQEAVRRLCEVSVHPDTAAITPLLLRPAAYVMVGAPLVVAALMPHKSVMSALIGQLFFQSYNAAFTAANMNLSVQSGSRLSQNPLYLSGSALYVACVGAAPTYVRQRLQLSSPPAQAFFGRILPPPLFALLGGLSVALLRISDVEAGIQVTDVDGKVIGVSQNAGKKAVKETAISRAALFGVTALVPSVVRRSDRMLRHPGLFSVVRLILAALTFGVVTPLSFSLFPRRGKIRREDLEEELREKTPSPELYYHRGL